MTRNPDYATQRLVAQVGLASIALWVIFGIYQLFTLNNKPVIESHKLVTPRIKNIVITEGKADTTFIYNFK